MQTLPVKSSIFQTGDSVNAVITEIQAMYPTEDANRLRALLMKFQNTVIDQLAKQNALAPTHPNYQS